MRRQIEASGTRGGSRGRWVSRSLATLGLAAAGVLALSGPAVAHVSVTPSTTAAGGHALLEFSVGHGCEGSPTTKVTISIPDSIYSVTPTRNPLWDVSVKTEPVDPPATDAHGASVTERVASVTYTTDQPLPDHQRDAFVLSLTLPDDEGSTLNFPTVQTCEQGESAWIEVPEEGGDPDELSLPAPSFELTAAKAGLGADGHASADEDTETLGTAQVVGLGLVGGLVGGALVGLVAMIVRTRARRTA